MKMHMTDGEILTMYRQAADPAKQVKILAELNVVSEKEMRAHLEGLLSGANVAPKKRSNGGREKWPLDEDRCAQLYAEGLGDLDLAEALGVPQWKVAAWRKKHGFARNPAARPAEVIHCDEAAAAAAEDTKRGAGETAPKDEKEEPVKKELEQEKREPAKGEARAAGQTARQGMPLDALVTILQQMEHGFPQGAVTVRGAGRVIGAEVRLRYGERGEMCGAVMELVTEGE